MDERAIVCLPTYNERENLEGIVRALGDQQVSVHVIDDNSLQSRPRTGQGP